jgi:hypothetical protein
MKSLTRRFAIMVAQLWTLDQFGQDGDETNARESGSCLAPIRDAGYHRPFARKAPYNYRFALQ